MPTPKQLIKQLDRLRSTLLKSGLQQKDQPLFQVIDTLLDVFRESLTGITGQISGNTGLAAQNYLTWLDNLVTLPNSKQLIDGENVVFDDSIAGQRIVNVPLEQVFLTGADETASLPNSRELLAGTGITFDDSIANERIINGVNDTQWSVLTTGNVDNPELVFVGGDVIMLHTP